MVKSSILLHDAWDGNSNFDPRAKSSVFRPVYVFEGKKKGGALFCPRIRKKGRKKADLSPRGRIVLSLLGGCKRGVVYFFLVTLVYICVC